MGNSRRPDKADAPSLKQRPYRQKFDFRMLERAAASSASSFNNSLRCVFFQRMFALSGTNSFRRDQLALLVKDQCLPSTLLRDHPFDRNAGVGNEGVLVSPSITKL
jgi:hypothetical protein